MKLRSEYNTAATVIASFGISLGTTVMNPVSITVTDALGWRNRFRVAGNLFFYLILVRTILKAHSVIEIDESLENFKYLILFMK